MVVWNLRDVKRDEIEKITKLVCKKILLKKKTRHQDDNRENSQLTTSL
jgi:hypothetical protein